MKPIVYCSGPLFSPEERGGMAALARVLEEAGYDTFLPQRDGLEAFVMRFVDSPLNANVLGLRDAVDAGIFALDVFQIVERCAGFVFNMNGRVPDEGGVAEAAIAFSVGRPVVLYKRDHRSAFGGRDNAMITGLAAAPVVDELSRVPAAVARALASSPAVNVSASQLVATVSRGRQIWTWMERLPADWAKDRGDGALLEEIARVCATG